MSRSLLPRRAMAVLFAALVASAALGGCLEVSISDELRVVETIPEPQGIAPAAHRISRSLGLGAEAADVESGRITGARVTVLGPEGADLFAILRLDINVAAGGERSLVASAGEFQEGETARELTVEFTSDIKPFLAAEDFTLEWDVFYKAGVDFPSGGLDLETVIDFDIDVQVL
jgi:hypothetical protein